MLNFNVLKNIFLQEMKLDKDTNIFQHIGEFQKFVDENLEDNLSIFSEDLENLNFKDNEFSSLSSDESIFTDLLNNFIKDETITDFFDTDKDKKFSEEELQNMINVVSGLDENDEDISLDDFTKLSELFETGNTEQLAQQLAAAPEIAQLVNEIETDLGGLEKSSGPKLTKANSHKSNYTAPSGNLNSKSTDEEIKKIDKEIETKNEEIIKKNNEKAQINSNDVQYTQLITDLNTQTEAISTHNSNITQFKGELHDIEYDLNATRSELNNLQDAVLFDEYQDEIDTRRSQLKSELNKLESDKKNKENEIKKEETALNNAEKEKAEIEANIKDYENTELKNNTEIQNINAEIATIQNEISSLETEKDDREEEIEKQRTQEQEDANVYGAAQAHRQSDLVKFMMDYATNPDTKEYYDNWYVNEWNQKGAYCAVFTSNISELLFAKAADKMGLSAEDLKTKMANSGDENNKSQGVTGLQMAMSADAWGDKVQSALDSAGINMTATVDITHMSEAEKRNAVRDGKIYPGMTFTYKRENGGYHTGFIESINKDLSWNTIEGNTAVKYDDGSSEIHTVGAHKGDATNGDLSSVADSTAKVLYWMSQMGYSKEDINSLIYSI